MADLHPELAYGLQKAIESLADQTTAVVDSSQHLTVEETLRAHYLIANHFVNEAEGIGGVGPKSMSLLESAISRQWVGFGEAVKWSSLYERAATVLYGLVCNHPFHDANKRTALISTAHLLRKNSVAYIGDVADFEELVVRVAQHSLEEYADYQDGVRQDLADPEVAFIATFLRTRCRAIDRSHRTLTYRELDTIIKRHGFWLDDPKGNRIGVYRNEETVSSSFFRKRTVTEKKRICRVGFPGWTKQAAKKDIKFIRKKLGLNEESGVDAAAFFQQAHDMRDLIKLYEGALNRLAHK